MVVLLTLFFSNAKCTSDTLKVEMGVDNECEWEAWVGDEDLL